MSWGAILSILEGAFTTFWLSLGGIFLGIPLGLGIAMLRVRRVPVLSSVLAVYVSWARATPLVTLSLLFYLGMPSLGLELGPRLAAFLAIVVNSAPFQSEVWRSSLLNFPKGQLDAARAAGMTGAVMFRRIVLPQAWRTSLPGLVNEATFLIKGSPAVAVIGVVDLTRAAARISSYTYDPITPFLTASVIYIIAIAGLVKLQRVLERATLKEYGVP